MPDSQQLPIVAGVDGSANSDRALDWAVSQATRSRRPLRVMHVPEPGLLAHFGFPPKGDSAERAVRAARELVDSRVARVREAAPDLAVSGEVIEGPRNRCLEDQSRAAHLLVLGAHGLGGVESLVTGSTTLNLAVHGSCPIVVVPKETTTTTVSRVVAGTDVSKASLPAVDLAFAQARLWEAALRIVVAWESSAFAWPADQDEGWPVDQEPSPEQARARIANFLAAKEAEYPNVPVEKEIVPGAAVPVLVDESDRADLLVVGSHGHGHGIMESLKDLGSVSRGVLRHARCPVAVVPVHSGSTSTE
ncbi:universal stress protein [Thermobifida halotolerans]|uniref:Universal stress protein n=1 Tax=Thermobifida halotolerans TaxID=483545 RepID=A0A399FX05_9ACTN|nr:universal stress protein [Thermobifida halotolerans]UOE18897.1 universal stress protein [Thermobifida halotolerans]